MAAQIFFVARLLAHQHHARVFRALANHCLSSMPPKIAAPAILRAIARRRQIGERSLDGFGHYASSFLGFLVATGKIRQPIADQNADLGSFRQVLPVFLRHLPLHDRRVDTRYIADASVVRAPEVFVLIAHGPRIGRRRIDEIQRDFVPNRGPFRRRDRPHHVRKALHEERRAATQYLVLGLEPREIRCVIAPIQNFAKAHKGMHLMNVPANRGIHPRRVSHIRIRCVLQQLPVLEQRSPRQPIHQFIAPGCAKATDAVE